MEDLLRGVYRQMKENSSKEKPKRKKVKPYENKNPFTPGDGLVVQAFENADGVWEVTDA